VRFAGVPEEFWGRLYEGGMALELSELPLSEVPQWVRGLVNLTTLRLHDCALAKLPDWLGELARLTTLDASENLLATVPESVGNLASLRHLDLSGNRIAVLPESVSRLEELETFFLNDNQLTGVPGWIGGLPALTTLGLVGNRLATLSDSLGSLGQLGFLDLSHNWLTALPVSLAGPLERGLTLRAEGNPLPEPYQELLARGPRDLAAYLRSLADATPQYEAKVVLVGEGGVGKSSLVAAMLGERFNPYRATTHGIEVKPLVMDHPAEPGEMLTLRLWDFGGQEVYRVTHQFFLTRRALNLVVWHARHGQEQDQVEDWLRRLRLRVKEEAPALVVATHCAERLADLDYPRLRKLFPEMLPDGPFEIDSATGQGIARLVAAIARHTAGLPQMGQLISKRWSAVRAEIVSRAAVEPQIRYGEYVSICRKHKLTDPETVTLARLMNDLGLVIYFGDDEGLRDIMVLNPEWLTRAISYVLNDNAIKDAAGLLDHGRLRELWSGADGYDPEYYPYFLRLMEKFDVSYRLDEDPDRSLVTQLVPYARPPLPWEPGEALPAGMRALSLVCELAEPAPGLIPWLTARHHEASVGKHWRSGVFLHHPIKAYHSQALLELGGTATRKDTELRLDVLAPAPEHYFNVLWDSIEHLITRRWPGLEYRLLVPCPGPAQGLDGDGGPCAGRFPLEDLIRKRGKGKTMVECGKCDEDIEIAELLTSFPAAVQPVGSGSPTTLVISGPVYGVVQAGAMHGTISLSNAAAVSEAAKGEDPDRLALLSAQLTDIAYVVRRTLRVVSTEVTDCPRMFTLSAAARTLKTRLRSDQHQYKLTLWCEHPGQEHPWEPGSYDIREPREWVIRIAPYARVVLAILKVAVPAVGSIVGGYDPIVTQPIAQGYLSATEAVLGALPSGDSTGQAVGSGDQGAAREAGAVGHEGGLPVAEGEGLRALRATIFANDEARAFGGLRRVMSPAGDLLWVCAHHYPIYDPGLPVIP
jgi:internalin A